MSNITIRRVHGEEMLDAMHQINSYAFGETPPMPAREGWGKGIEGVGGITTFILFEDDQPMACVAEGQMTQNVRGKAFPMGGLWGVATHPLARRKGYARQALTRLLHTIREDGKPLSCLYPFRESFYERLGYATFPQIRAAKFHAATLAPLLKLDLDGEFELVPLTEGFQRYQDFVGGLREQVHGIALFDYPRNITRDSAWLLFVKIAGEEVGLISYNLREVERSGQYKMRIGRFYYTTTPARYLLLQWIARHIDQANQIEVWLPPFELPETWLADMDVKTEVPHITPMGRVLDVAKIGGMPTGAGRFSARISDPVCPWNEAIWQFETVDGMLQVSAAESADCDLSIQGLSALVYGTHNPADFAIRGWGDPSPTVQQAMRAVFPPMLPYLHEFF